MLDSNFQSLVSQTFEAIIDKIINNDPKELIEYNSSDEAVTIDTNRGQYLLNRQAALQEIWLVSPLSGPFHFRYIENTWLSSTKIELLQLLFSELTQITGISFAQQ